MLLDKVVIEDYHDMTTKDENVKWMNQTRLLLIWFSELQGPFLYISIYFKILNCLF